MSEQPLDPFTADAVPQVHEDFFMNHAIIQKIAHEEHWTVSDNEKQPVHAKDLLAENVIKPAHWRDGNPLVALTDIDRNPDFAFVNRAYRLHARDNRVIAIDVEPHAAIEMKQMVWDFPGHLRELSRNGGIHLLIEVPEDCIDDANRYLFNDLSVFKEPVPPGINHKSTYEVLFNDHYITFTKKLGFHLEATDFEQDPAAKAKLKSFLDNLVRLDAERREQRELMKQHRAELEEAKMTPEVKAALEMLLGLPPIEIARETVSAKTLEDYGGDASRYESSVASSYAHHIMKTHRMALQTISYKDQAKRLGENELIRGVYELLVDTVEYRPKHDEEREGYPWLLYVARNGYTFVKSQKARDKQSRH